MIASKTNAHQFFQVYAIVTEKRVLMHHIPRKGRNIIRIKKSIDRRTNASVEFVLIFIV
jgi:hypothetical protein